MRGLLPHLSCLSVPHVRLQVRSWTLRQVTPLAVNVHRVHYPIPPAGADPLTWQSDEEPPPLGITYPLPADVCLLQARSVVSMGRKDATSPHDHALLTEGGRPEAKRSNKEMLDTRPPGPTPRQRHVPMPWQSLPN